MMFFKKVIPEVCGTCKHAEAKHRSYKIADEVTGEEVFFEIVCPYDKRKLKTYNSPKRDNGSYARANIFKRIWIKGLCL